MGYTIQAVGIGLTVCSVWLRALRKITTNLTAFWGIVGILLIAAKAASPLSSRIEKPDAMGKQRFCFFGVWALMEGLTASLIFSRLAMKNQELSVQISLLLQEQEERLTRMDKMDEKNSFCN